ncbi:hypothetical protein VS868_11850 [Salinimicrobium sp. 3283s]
MITFLTERFTEIVIGVGVGAAIYGAMYFVATRCFDDEDPDLDPWDSFN